MTELDINFTCWKYKNTFIYLHCPFIDVKLNYSLGRYNKLENRVEILSQDVFGLESKFDRMSKGK